MNGLFFLITAVLVYILIGILLARKEWLNQKKSLIHSKAEPDELGQEVVDSHIYDSDYYINTGSIEDFIHLPAHLSRAFDVACLKPGERVLDLGCGKGQLAYHCALSECLVTAVDYSEAAVLLAKRLQELLPKTMRERMTVLMMDFHDLPEDGKFDVIFMTDLVEHLYDWQLKELFEKMQQILAPQSGRIVIHTAPNKYFINIIFPLKRMLTWPSIIGKTGSKGSFFYTRSKYFYDLAMHVNEQTPESLRKHLKEFESKVWCEDGSANVLSWITKRFAGADIWAIARVKESSTK